jgi:hypothetical protein
MDTFSHILLDLRVSCFGIALALARFGPVFPVVVIVADNPRCADFAGVGRPDAFTY